MERMKKAGVHTRGRVEYYLNTADAWAAFEDIILDARRDVVAVFDRFDATAAVQVARPGHDPAGQDWAWLLAQALMRGVDLTITLGSAPEADALRSRIQGELHAARRYGTLTVTAHAHPARRDSRRFGNFAQFPAGHRLNLAVVDGKALFLARDGLTAAAVQAPWHDLAIIARGPVVAEAMAVLSTFGAITAGTAEPGPARRLLRTLSRPAHGIRRMFGAQTVVNEVESAHHMLIRRAEHLIYIETQIFDSLPLARHLALRAKSAPDLNLVLILPLRSGETPSQRRCLALLTAAFGPRLFIGQAAGGVADVSIFDAQTAIAGSADLNCRALGYDTHAAIYLRQADGVGILRDRLARRWLGEVPDGDDAAQWRAAADMNLSLGKSGDGVLLPLAPPGS